VERFNLASVDTASIVTEAEKSKGAKGKTKGEKGKTKNAKTAGEIDAGAENGQPEPDIGVQEKAEKDRLMDALMGKPIKKEENAPNPSLAKTEKSPLSEPTLKQQRKSAEGATMTKAEKPSVREELRKIKEGRKEQEADVSPAKEKSSDRAKKPPAGKTEHKQPQKRKHRPKSKGAR
jgi:hypothetical protein